MANEELYVNKPGLEENVRNMREGLEQLNAAVKRINKAVDESPNNWKGATQTAYMQQYNDLRKTITNDVPEAVDGMAKFMDDFLHKMIEADSEIAGGMGG